MITGLDGAEGKTARQGRLAYLVRMALDWYFLIHSA